MKPLLAGDGTAVAEAVAAADLAMAGTTHNIRQKETYNAWI
jgi:hypothetical protein